MLQCMGTDEQVYKVGQYYKITKIADAKYASRSKHKVGLPPYTTNSKKGRIGNSKKHI